MVLREFDDSTDTRDINHTRCVPRYIFAALRKQAKEGSGHKVDRESVDLVHVSPFLERLVVEQCAPQCLDVLVLRTLRILEKRRDGACLPRTVSTDQSLHSYS